jgi:hypothetical protein
MRDTIHQWAGRHGVSHAALDELERMLGLEDLQPSLKREAGKSEGAVQNNLRLHLAQYPNWRVWRNNVGALKDSRGVPVRYGLANDSPAMNEKFKSSDLICGEKIQITQEMIGQWILQHVHIECKAEGWEYTGTERERAQLRWLMMIVLAGGRAYFFNGQRYDDPRNFL